MGRLMPRYEIYFDDCDSFLTAATETEAKHKAALNAGAVYDTETGDIIADYRHELFECEGYMVSEVWDV